MAEVEMRANKSFAGVPGRVRRGDIIKVNESLAREYEDKGLAAKVTRKGKEKDKDDPGAYETKVVESDKKKED